jgi:Tol biopolymer transport system component
MLDLYNKKYSMDILKENIYAVSLLDILKTQIIDVKFAVNYILNMKYQLHKNDNITAPMVLRFQPHISYNELQKELLDYESDDDYIIDFEKVSNIPSNHENK